MRLAVHGMSWIAEQCHHGKIQAGNGMRGGIAAPDPETEGGGGLDESAVGMRRRMLLGDQRRIKGNAMDLAQTPQHPYQVLRTPFPVHVHPLHCQPLVAHSKRCVIPMEYSKQTGSDGPVARPANTAESGAQRSDDAVAGERHVAQPGTQRIVDRVADRRSNGSLGALTRAQRRRFGAVDQHDFDFRHLGEAQDRVFVPGPRGD
jgi:hypothetical protein